MIILSQKSRANQEFAEKLKRKTNKKERLMSDETRSIRVIPFSGTLKSEYPPWKVKTRAIRSKYGWIKALKADLTHDEIGSP